MSGQVEVSRVIDADAAAVWALVSDVTRMGEWSPETESCAWIGSADGPAAGAQFKGVNRIGWRRWSTKATVTEATPGESFVFDVKAGPMAVSTWGYRFEPTDGGCRVTEFWRDNRNGFTTFSASLLTGVKDRAARNRETMTETLERLAAAVEA